VAYAAIATSGIKSAVVSTTAGMSDRARRQRTKKRDAEFEYGSESLDDASDTQAAPAAKRRKRATSTAAAAAAAQQQDASDILQGNSDADINSSDHEGGDEDDDDEEEECIDLDA
jgi:hypothetical protein